jgi:DsbC/DsbD-like thiol-disulfide interchange protein
MTNRKSVLALAALALNAVAAQPGGWTDAVEVRHDDDLCISYQAKVDGPYLLVRATVAPGWHTFAMDNKRRADEKLGGKPALSVDRATEITSAAGLEPIQPWYQSPPKDFSHPELRWFSWGFDRQAIFVAKVRRTSGAAAHLNLRGQACTDSLCKNIDVELSVPLASVRLQGDLSDVNLKDLVPVR